MSQIKSNNPINNKYLADNWRNILLVKNFDILHIKSGNIDHENTGYS